MSTTLTIRLDTGNDDLRSDSWLNLTINWSGGQKQIPKFVTGSLPGNTSTVRTLELEENITADNVLNFQIEQISQEGTFETRDNWDMSGVQITLGTKRAVVLAHDISWRFTGARPTIAFIDDTILK